MSGYYGYSMSNNAVEAYGSGEMPWSKWTKGVILSEISEAVENGEMSLSYSPDDLAIFTAEDLRRYALRRSSWHHTSKHFNKTDFYSLDVDYLEGLTTSEIVRIAEENKAERKAEREKKKEADEVKKARCRYLVWRKGSRRPKEITEEGVIKGKWFYCQDGTKKNIYGNYFWVIAYL